jgi:hypothetical protein
MQAQDITLDKVLSSKVYLNEKSMVNFGSPRQYLEPFMEKLTKAGLNPSFTVNVSDRIANKETENENINEAYGRVLIQAKLPEAFTAHNHDSVIGMVYALDTAKPSIRVYSGENAWACTNLAIFGARYVHEVPIMSGVGSIYEKTMEFIDGLTAQLARFQTIYEAMNDKQLQNEEIDRTIGHLLREANRNKAIGTTPVLSAVQDLDNPKSRYSIIEGKTTQWNIYSALTQYCTDKVNIFEKANKTVLLSNLFVKDL